jgi:hypothetical protein
MIRNEAAATSRQRHMAFSHRGRIKWHTSLEGARQLLALWPYMVATFEKSSGVIRSPSNAKIHSREKAARCVLK